MSFRLPLLLFCAALTACASTPEQPKAPAAPLVLGADISALPVMESHHATFSDEKGGKDALQILRGAGANCFRLRLFVTPDHKEMVTNDLPYTLALARRVRASGAELMLDIHYSDTWADPSKQFIPASWVKLSREQLEAKVHDYTRSVIALFAIEGVLPDYVQVGNEITNGMLWPIGKAEFGVAGDQPGWDQLARFLKAGIQGVKDGAVGRKMPRIVIHVDSTGNVPRSQWFFRNAKARGVEFDIIGLSFYSDWHGKVAGLSATMNGLASEFGKPVMVVETAYPWKHDEHWDKSPNLEQPLTPAGQKNFLTEVRAAVAAVPGGLGAGVIYWHPESIQARGVNAWLGGSCALFDDQGRLLPGAALFSPSR